ncbi:MAG: DsbA family protein [Patescibacteria group bacterium]
MNHTLQPSWKQNIWFSVSLGLLGVIVGYMAAQFMAGRNTPVAVQNPTPSPQEEAPSYLPPPPVDAEADHIKGNPNARFSLIVYSDFDCPYSKRHHPTLTQITDAYKDQVNVVYRHFPLSFHPTAQIKAEASECVAELAGNSAFWSFTDALYDPAATAPQTKEELVALGGRLDVDEARLDECISSGKYAGKVKDDMQAGSSAGVTGTPGNILVDNSSKETNLLVGARPFEAFKGAIDQALAK